MTQSPSPTAKQIELRPFEKHEGLTLIAARIANSGLTGILWNKLLVEVDKALAAEAALALEQQWQPIETAQRDKSLLLYCVAPIPIYCGRHRYGEFGEPQRDVLAWRCDSSGRFANPTQWAALIPPSAPKKK